MSAPRRRSPEPKTCDCLRVTHACGTRTMYDVHRCGCDPCLTAKNEYITAQRAGKTRRDPRPPEPAHDSPEAITTTGQFVATFPVHGGVSETRAARQAYDQLIALTRDAGVVVKGAWSFRLDHTATGAFLIARAPAETNRPCAEVLAAAERFADEHQLDHPLLAKWVGKHLAAHEGVAA